MAGNRVEDSQIKRGSFLVERVHLRARLDCLLTGLAQSIDRHGRWLRLYITLACAVDFIYSYVTAAQSGLNLATSVAAEITGIALITVALAWGRRLYHLNRQRRFGRLVMILIVVASLIC